jgi:E3 ubiquitin-protein ligase UBR7
VVSAATESIPIVSEERVDSEQTSTEPPATSDPPVSAAQGDEEEDDDEETAILIPSDTYDGLVCAACAGKSAYIGAHKGKDGWMIIELNENDQAGYQVIGRQEPSSAKTGDKRSLQESDADKSAKRIKLDDEDTGRVEKVEDGGEQSTRLWKGKGDVFLAHGIRERLAESLDVSWTNVFVL